MLSFHYNMLIVDDSRLTRMMIRNIVLNKYPAWTIIEAQNSTEAIAQVESTPIDVITIDLNMPGGDGLTLAAQLQEMYQKRNIALLTANIQDSIRQKAEALGIGFIPKPITKEKILNFLSQMENKCGESNRITTR